MEIWLYIILILIVLIAIIVLIVGAYRKEKATKTLMLDKQLLSDMVSMIEPLISNCNCVNNDDLLMQLENIQQNIQYTAPSSDYKIYQTDLTINNRICDLKLIIRRAVEKGTFNLARKSISEIDLLIVERNSKLR